MTFDKIPYKRPDMDKLEQGFNQLIQRIRNSTDCKEQQQSIAEVDLLRKEFESYASLASIRHTQDTKDEYYEKQNSFFDENLPTYELWVTDYFKALLESPCRKDLEKSLGSQLFHIAEIQQLSFSEQIMEEMKQENLLTSQYVKLLSSAQIPFQGELRTLAQLTPFEESTDRDLRREALAARFTFFEENGEQLDRIFDELVKLRTSMGRKMGYDNYIALGYARMMRTGYGPADVARFRSGVQQYLVPLAEELYRDQWKRIGLDKAYTWDKSFRFPSGNPTPKGDRDWMVEKARGMYKELSPETDSFFQFMVERNLLDLEARQAKAGGGYCDMLPLFGTPFIFSNFNGTSHDVDVLTHEAGHAFQVYSSRDLPLDYLWPSYEACEVHSMSMEYFAMPWMEEFFQEDAHKYRFDHLVKNIQFIPYGVSVDEFQHRIYEQPDLSPAERHQVWLEMEEKYQPSLDNGGIPYLEKGGFWQKQTHIYKTPFYYIDYTLAESCAMQYWIWMEQDRDAAWKSYRELCSKGGTASFLELISAAGLKSPFQETLFEDILEKIRPWLDRVDSSRF